MHTLPLYRNQLLPALVMSAALPHSLTGSATSPACIAASHTIISHCGEPHPPARRRRLHPRSAPIHIAIIYRASAPATCENHHSRSVVSDTPGNQPPTASQHSTSPCRSARQLHRGSRSPRHADGLLHRSSARNALSLPLPSPSLLFWHPPAYTEISHHTDSQILPHVMPSHCQYTSEPRQLSPQLCDSGTA